MLYKERKTAHTGVCKVFLDTVQLKIDRQYIVYQCLLTGRRILLLDLINFCYQAGMPPFLKLCLQPNINYIPG